MVAHDLRSPLTALTAWTEMLEDELLLGPVGPDVALPMLDSMRAAALRMRTLIDDLLRYTVARDQTLLLQPVDLAVLVGEIADLQRRDPRAPQVLVGGLPVVWADPALLLQLMDNLIGNAVRYVAPGVRPRVLVEGEVDGDWLELTVSDNGIGVPPGERSRIFEALHRAHRDDYMGTGLGLAICRHIAERHGGSIEVRDHPHGAGSVFAVRLPRSAEEYARHADGRDASARQPAADQAP